ncbi:transcription/translation regulatory transformer protein RfaH [Arhodomonas sp. SL1]|uniref:transcription/translation regulatory transformer protein RfaH n=1 Tax=Arhodomonas sp. SL1 TaxID=3425691 RepID=UPI003F880E23
MGRWYAVQCKPGQDERAETHLANQGYHIYRPLARVRGRRNGKPVDRVESLFPRYLFIELEAGTDNWAPIRSTRGVSGIVRFGERPAPVPDGVIEELRGRLTDQEGTVDLRPFQRMQPNQRVRIESGPFAGYEALFQAARGEDRVLVLLEVMQRSQRLTVSADAVTPVDR